MSSVSSRGRSLDEVLHDLGFAPDLWDHQSPDGSVSITIQPTGCWENIPVGRDAGGTADRGAVLRAMAAEFRRMAGVCEVEAGLVCEQEAGLPCEQEEATVG